MAIDFSQVKSLTIPEGEVTKITDSSGNVLWQKITQGWHTLWEGSVTSHNGSSPIDVATLSELSGTVKLRVYWSCNMSGGSNMTDSYFFNHGAAMTTDKPDSPFQFDLNADKPKLQIIGGIRYNSDTSQGRNCQLKWSAKNKKFTLAPSTYSGGDGGVDLSMTITKIEQYY